MDGVAGNVWWQETFGGRKGLVAGNVWWNKTFIKFVGFKGNVNVNTRKLRLKSGMSDSHKVPCKHCLNWIFLNWGFKKTCAFLLQKYHLKLPYFEKRKC